MENLIKLEGRNGSVTIKGNSTNKYYALVVTEACVFTVMTEKGAVNALVEQGKTAITVPAGTVVTPRREFFENITITSGTVEGYLL